MGDGKREEGGSNAMANFHHHLKKKVKSKKERERERDENGFLLFRITYFYYEGLFFCHRIASLPKEIVVNVILL